MDRSQKADLVDELKRVFSETSVVVVTRNLGLSVAQSTDLRLKMRDAGAQFKVAKNRLALIALEDTQYKPIGDLLKGPTALATSSDPVAAAKVAVDFAKTNDRLEIVGRRVEADDHVAAPVRETFENRKENLLFIVARTVWLDSGAEVLRGADRHAGTRKRIEQRAGDD